MLETNESNNNTTAKLILIYSIRIFKILRKESPSVLYVIIFFSFVSGFVPPLMLVVMREIIAQLEIPIMDFRSILLFIIIYLSIEVISEIITNIQNYLTFKLQNITTLTIKEMIFNKSINLSLRQYENSNTYDMIQRAQNNQGYSIFAYFSIFLIVLKISISIIGYIIIIIFWRWIVLIPLIAFSVIRTVLIAKLSKKQFEIVRERTDKERERWYYEFLLTNDIAFKEIKLHKIGRFFINRYKELFKGIFTQDKKIQKEFSIIQTILSLLDIIITGVVFIVLILDAVVGAILIADTITFMRSFISLKSNIVGLMGQFSSIYQKSLYIGQLFEFLDQKEENSNEGIEISKIELIEIFDLSYKYPNSGKYVLQNINLKIERGQLLAIMGKNGSGKSTLLKLISGYYADYEGEIFINKINLKELNKDVYRKHISVFFQDYTKFELSVRDNVSLSKVSQRENDIKIEKNLVTFHMSQDYYKHLDKRLGFWFPGGTQLSGGEWARIALARVFFKESSLNIFDEPNASLDAEMERTAFAQIRKLTTKNISIIVTHKMSNLKHYVDNMLVMHKGEIVAMGLHEDLINSPFYRELLQEEMKENDINE